MQWWSINLSESPIKGGTLAGSFSASMVRNKGNYKQRNAKNIRKVFLFDWCSIFTPEMWSNYPPFLRRWFQHTFKMCSSCNIFSAKTTKIRKNLSWSRFTVFFGMSLDQTLFLHLYVCFPTYLTANCLNLIVI